MADMVIFGEEISKVSNVFKNKNVSGSEEGS